MKALTPGHLYIAANFEKPEMGQTIQFIEKENRSIGGEDQLVTIKDGTTNEELIDVLVDRLNYLNNLFPCRENSLAITHLQEAQNWLFRRTRDRERRGVEGKNLS